MTKMQIIKELPKLTRKERGQIQAKIAEIDGGGWMDAGDLSDEEKVIIERRLTEHQKNPKAVVPWREVEARLIRRFGK